MLSRNDQRVLGAADAVVQRLGSNPAHTVAAAAIDVSGRVHTAVNVSHFTGGPCAELSVLGQVAAVSDDRVMTIVAVGDRGRGVVPPCGRCRQVLLDLHPDTLVIVPGPDGAPEATPVRALLPTSYASVDNGGPDTPRVLRFAGRYRDDVLAGRKRVTIRFRDPHRVGPVTFVFEDAARDGFDAVPGSVEQVGRRLFGDLTIDDARDEGLDDVETLRRALREHYPDLSDSDSVDVVRIALRR